MFLNKLLQDQAGFSLPTETTDLIIKAAITLIIGYSFQDAIHAWNAKGGNDLLDMIAAVVREIVDESFDKAPEVLPPDPNPKR